VDHSQIRAAAEPQHAQAKRDRITIVTDILPYPTESLAVVVLADDNGNPMETATEIVVLLPPAMTSVQQAGTEATTPNSQQLETTFTNSISAASTGAAASAGGLAAQPGGIQGGGLVGQPGVTYSPYNADGTCKSSSRVFSDFQTIATQYGLVRIYGVDCNQVAMAVSAAKATGVQLFLGIFNLDGLDQQIQTLVEGVYAHADWSVVDTISVGNELVNNGQATAQQVINAVYSARQSLRNAGFAGPVVTVDTFIAVINNPWLCDYSDFCAMNIHPFFDPNTPASAAGNFLANQVARVRQTLANPDQRIVVTETGWPWQGSANGAAVPGKENQRTALASIRSGFSDSNPGNVIFFTAFNDPWKKAEPSTFYAEQYWGINQFQ
jgi:exo-beta-1,3-glucanase (GH17 family)